MHDAYLAWKKFYLDNRDRVNQYYLDNRDREQKKINGKIMIKLLLVKRFILLIDIKQILIFVQFVKQEVEYVKLY